MPHQALRGRGEHNCTVDNLVLFLITGGATFVATLPAVYLGLAKERRDRERTNRNSERQATIENFATFTEPGGIVYDCRDWAQAVEKAVEQQEPLILSDRQPSTEGLRWLLHSQSVPPPRVTAVAQLLDEATLLRELVVPHLGNTISGPQANLLWDRARRTGDLAPKLVKDAEVDPGRRAALDAVKAPST